MFSANKPILVEITKAVDIIQHIPTLNIKYIELFDVSYLFSLSLQVSWFFENILCST